MNTAEIIAFVNTLSSEETVELNNRLEKEIMDTLRPRATKSEKIISLLGVIPCYPAVLAYWLGPWIAAITWLVITVTSIVFHTPAVIFTLTGIGTIAAAALPFVLKQPRRDPRAMWCFIIVWGIVASFTIGALMMNA